MRAGLFAVAMICGSALAQTAKPEFEAASVKAATPLGPAGMRSDRKGGPGTSDPGLYTCRNCPLSWVVYEAYDLKAWEFQGPDWLSERRFDFEAKLPADATKPVFREMLQRLLEDRFRLAVHREKKEMQVYELTVAKNGPKFRQPAPEGNTGAADGPGPIRRDAEGFPILGPNMTMAIVPGHARLRADHRSMSWFADQLSNQLGGPVTDATGLKENYDFIVSWAFGEDTAAVVPGEAPGAPRPEPFRPALVQAVQSQLGLRLDRKKAPVEVLVVDHIEKAPSAN
jgi:uncharacterized protein (TIGR03435 family)